LPLPYFFYPICGNDDEILKSTGSGKY